MCGIGGIHVFNPGNAPKWLNMEHAIDALFTTLDYRGGDATGFVAIGDDSKSVWQKASCDASAFFKERRALPFNTRSVIVHTRMATQGSAAFPENNHPIRRGSVYIVHNGHIYNDWEVFKKVNRDRYGQVDSEAIAILIAKHGIMNTHRAMEEISGAAAIAVVDETRPGLMALARGSSSPLMFYKNDNVAVFGSTIESVKRAWTCLYGSAPKDKHIENVKEGTAIYLDKKTHRKKFTPDDFYITKYAYAPVTDTITKMSDKWDNYSVDDYKGVILCSHGCRTKDCEICSTAWDSEWEEVDGHESFLPMVREEDETACELCGLLITGKIVRIKEVDDTWVMCENCAEELAEVSIDCEIHRVPLRENDSIYTKTIPY